ncbi:MAG TPA: heme-binding domain-containing protein [Bryobacteraceae bacterium]|jgi:hypothetical protein
MRWFSVKSAVCVVVGIMIAGVGLPHPVTRIREVQPLLHGAVPIDIDSIFSRACQDCHSNKTVLPWYAHVPPMSKLVADDVERGRKFMNLSDWQSYSKGQKLGYLTALSNAVSAGEMPPQRYTFIHGDARLTDAERLRIAAWAKEESARLTQQ